MIIVTSGGAYTDIDAYAGCVAYAELLRLQGKKAEAVLEPPLNASTTPYLRGLPVRYMKTYRPENSDTYVLIDVSEERFFAHFVAHDRIVEIIDHHPGFEAYWVEQHHVKTQIEVVGAACTQVVEHWMQSGKISSMSPEIAKLLMAGILDNTLGLKAHITNERDRVAYQQLQIIINDDGRFMKTYFEDCQKTIEQDIVDSVKNDIKTPTYPGLGMTITGQLAVWNSSELLRNHLKAIYAGMGNGAWLCNLIGIDEGRSSFITNDETVRDYISGLLHVEFDHDIAHSDRLWLRKEIMKAAIDDAAER